MPRGCSCPASGVPLCPRCARLMDYTFTPSVKHSGISHEKVPSLRQCRKNVSQDPGVKLGDVRRQKLASLDRYKSDTERRYASLLEQWQREGVVAFWRYEPCKGLWLAPALSYSPDFLVIWATRPQQTDWHEVKGAFVRPQDWNRLKMAAAQYPCWRFVLAQWQGGAWAWQVIPAI